MRSKVSEAGPVQAPQPGGARFYQVIGATPHGSLTSVDGGQQT